MKKYQRQVVLIIVMFALAFVNNGCAVIHAYQTGGPQGREMANQPGTEWESKPSNVFFWGAVRQDVTIPNCTLGNGERLNIEEFKIERNFVSIVAYIITLGIWDHAKVSWRCAKPKN